LPYVVVDSPATEEQTTELKDFSASRRHAIVPHNLSPELASLLGGMGYRLKKVNVPEPDVQRTPGLATDAYDIQQTVPWTWIASGARSVISLTAGVASLEPFVANAEDAKEFNPLLIQGTGETQEIAEKRLKELTIILESGSLPIPVMATEFIPISLMVLTSFLVLISPSRREYSVWT